MPGDLNLSLVLKADASGFKGEVRTAGAELKDLTEESRRAGSSIGPQIARGTATAAAGMQRSRASAINLRGAMGQLGFQAQDLAIQLAAGVNPLQVLAVQGGQAASAFGPLGIAIGTVITVAGIAGSVLFGLSRDTEDATEAADRFGETEDRLKDLLRVATSDIHDQADAVADLSGALRDAGVATFEKQLAEARVALIEHTGAIRDAIAEAESALLAPRPDEIGVGILEALDAIDRAAADDEERVRSLIRALEQVADPDLSAFVDRLREGNAEAANTMREIGSLEQALNDLAKGTTLSSKERADAEREVQQATRDAAREAEKAGREADREAERAARRRRQAAAQFQETSSWIDRQRAATKGYDDALREADRKGMTLAQGLTGGLERAAFATGTLTEKVVDLGEELARVLFRMFALEPLAQALGVGISRLFAPAAPAAVQTGPGGLAVGGGVTSQLHAGGVVGRDGVPRLVDPVVFAGAQRFHLGGIAGLRPDEVPIIAQRGERILPAGAGLASPVVNVSVVNQATGSIAETRERRRPDGGRDVIVLIRDEVSRQIVRGDHDRALRSRFGVEPTPARR